MVYFTKSVRHMISINMSDPRARHQLYTPTTLPYLQEKTHRVEMMLGHKLNFKYGRINLKGKKTIDTNLMHHAIFAEKSSVMLLQRHCTWDAQTAKQVLQNISNHIYHANHGINKQRKQFTMALRV